MSVTVTSTSEVSNYLTTKSRFKLELNLSSTSTSYDTYINDLISEASDYISNECNRTFQKQNYEETCGGSGRAIQVLSRIPLVSIESVYNQDNEISSTCYNIEDKKSGQVFASTMWVDTSFVIQNIEPMVATEKSPDYTFNYTAGWVLPSTSTDVETRTLPSDIERACLDYMKIIWNERFDNPMTKSQKTGDASETKFSITDFVNSNVYSPAFLPPNIERILKKYRIED